MAANANRDPGLNGRPRQRAIAQVRKTQPVCWLCGRWVDQTLDQQRHPLASTIDEIIPRSRGGSTLDPANLGHAHRTCNSTRGARMVNDTVRAECLDAYERHQARTTNRSRTW